VSQAEWNGSAAECIAKRYNDGDAMFYKHRGEYMALRFDTECRSVSLQCIFAPNLVRLNTRILGTLSVHDSQFVLLLMRLCGVYVCQRMNGRGRHCLVMQPSPIHAGPTPPQTRFPVNHMTKTRRIYCSTISVSILGTYRYSATPISSKLRRELTSSRSKLLSIAKDPKPNSISTSLN
jgi:hypothetical protein